MLEMTINLGTVLEIIAMVGSIAYFVYSMKTELAVLANSHRLSISRLDSVDSKLEKLSTVIVDLARQEERMNAQDTRINEISNRVVETLKAMPPPVVISRRKR